MLGIQTNNKSLRMSSLRPLSIGGGREAPGKGKPGRAREWQGKCSSFGLVWFDLVCVKSRSLRGCVH